jgi:ABC-2 type transport system permease protein
LGNVSGESAIHDIGYQRYTGARLGRGYAIRSLYVHSMRAAFGIGRGAKAKIFPWLIIGIALAFALILIAVKSITQQELMSYQGYANAMSYPVMMFLAIIAPELVSRDLRDKTLPLYFSRPLRRSDYALTKLASLMTAVVLLIAVPELFIFIGAAFSADKDRLQNAWLELQHLGPGLVAAVFYAFVLSSLALMVASLTSRRAFGAAGVVAVFLITTPIVGILYVIGENRSPALRDLSQLANPMTATRAVLQWLFGADKSDVPPLGSYGPVYGVAVVALVAVCISLLLARYRKVAA